MNTDGIKLATTRITRSERKARTRLELLASARRVFLRRGFHGASLEEIADDAGYTKGAVYSNFADKDALYLAVLEEHYGQRIEAYESIILDEDDLDDAFLAVSRFMAESDARDPDWLPLLAEFVAHAAQHEPVRRDYARTRERFLDAIAEIIAALAARHAVSLRVSPREAARGSSVLARGLSAERRLDPEAMPPDLFVELHNSYLRGLVVRGGA